MLGGYKFVGSVTAEERFVGAMIVTIAVRLNISPLFRAPLSRGGGVLRVMLPNAEFGLGLYWA